MTGENGMGAKTPAAPVLTPDPYHTRLVSFLFAVIFAINDTKSEVLSPIAQSMLGLSMVASHLESRRPLARLGEGL
jgi:hypothetical protein